MVTPGMLVLLRAKDGKEAELLAFLRAALAVVREEPGTTAWFAIRMSPLTFGIFDAFPDEAGLRAHLGGKAAAALQERGLELLAGPPEMEPVEVIAAKVPL
jgi:quinol monooxygenase YgiN